MTYFTISFLLLLFGAILYTSHSFCYNNPIHLHLILETTGNHLIYLSFGWDCRYYCENIWLIMELPTHDHPSTSRNRKEQSFAEVKNVTIKIGLQQNKYTYVEHCYGNGHLFLKINCYWTSQMKKNIYAPYDSFTNISSLHHKIKHISDCYCVYQIYLVRMLMALKLDHLIWDCDPMSISLLVWDSWKLLVSEIWI